MWVLGSSFDNITPLVPTQQHTTTRLSAMVFLTSWVTPCFIKDMMYWKYIESKSRQAHGDGVYIPKIWHMLGGSMVSFALANRCMIADQSFHCSRSGWLSPSPMACMIRNIYWWKVAMYAASITNRLLLKVYSLCRCKDGVIAWMGILYDNGDCSLVWLKMLLIDWRHCMWKDKGPAAQGNNGALMIYVGGLWNSRLVCRCHNVGASWQKCLQMSILLLCCNTFSMESGLPVLPVFICAYVLPPLTTAYTIKKGHIAVPVNAIL